MEPLAIPVNADSGPGGDGGSPREVTVECGGASTTSAGSWHLGLLRAGDEGDSAADWLSTYLNDADKDKVSISTYSCYLSPGTYTLNVQLYLQAKKKRARFRLLRAHAIRLLSRYAGPTQVHQWD